VDVIANGNNPRATGELRLISQPGQSTDLAHKVRVLHTAATRGDLLQVVAVGIALQELGGFEQIVVDVGPCIDDATLAELGLAGVRYIPLPVTPAPSSEMTSYALRSAAAILTEERPELVVTAGETDATLAWALAAAKLHLAVAMLDAGTRSWDWSDVSEINRVVCDRLADGLFTATQEATRNLLDEGVPDTRVHEVGSPAVDVVLRLANSARARAAWLGEGLTPGGYVIAAFEQPANVDDPVRANAIARALADRKEQGATVALVSRRVGTTAPAQGLTGALSAAGISCLRPPSVLDELSLIAGAGAVITDTGVMQDITSSFGVSCFVLGCAGPGPATFVHPTCIPLGDDAASLSGVTLGPWPPNLTAIPVWESRAAQSVATTLEANFALRVASPGALR
jgi:UDP-N-acetylglucosamine 2-epimerase (non-hydrolysing)